MTPLDRDAVLKAAATAVVVCLPLTLIANVVHDHNADSPWLGPLFFFTALGFVLAGWVGGRSSKDAPYSNGAVGALSGFAVMAVVSIVVRLAGSGAVHAGRLVGIGLIAYAAGLVGAAAAGRKPTT